MKINYFKNQLEANKSMWQKLRSTINETNYK